MKLMDKIKDALHLDLFHRTMKEIKKLKSIESEPDRYKELNRFIQWLKNRIPFDTFYPIAIRDYKINNWDDFYLSLEYYSDRWNMSRLSVIYIFYKKWKDEEKILDR